MYVKELETFFPDVQFPPDNSNKWGARRGGSPGGSSVTCLDEVRLYKDSPQKCKSGLSVSLENL